MCTAVTYTTKGFYFGRTLDYEYSFSEEVTVMPRRFPLLFRKLGRLDEHYAIIGMAHVADEYPLYYDGVNEKGLAIAGLNFVGYADYKESVVDKDNVAHFELIPWVLAQCANTVQAKKLLERVNITDTAFNEKLAPARLHWIIADREEAIVVESVKEGLRIYHNPVGVLTNNPPFDRQLFQLNNYMHLSAKPPENLFSDKLVLQPYSHGMGALGLPGDLSSQSRFVRAAFTKLNSVSGDSETESVNQFFHILGAVEQTRGCCQVESGGFSKTIYTSCCSCGKGKYYYTTYKNHQLSEVDMNREDLDASFLVRYPIMQDEQIRMQN